MILKDNFYRAFEEKYRGSRENIKERQKIYLPFILPLHEIYPDDMVLDIGCGRGEWLELMQDNDIPAKGVDLDERMLEAGLSLGLNVEKGDGITFLQGLLEILCQSDRMIYSKGRTHERDIRFK